jgi:hypothetical protein
LGTLGKAGAAAWYWNRLRAMSGPEVVRRVSERFRRRGARSIGGWGHFAIEDGPLPAFPGLKDRLAGLDGQLQDDWRAVLSAARAGRYRLLGQDWPGITDPAKWSLDPVTGRSWPADTYCFDIGFRGDLALGDVKYVAELNRLQFLQPIAALAAATDDAELAAYCAAEIESWIDANPPFKGVNWLSGVELALRVASLIIVVGFIGEQPFSADQKQKLRTALNAHGFRINRYSSAGAHLIAEAAALFLLGSLAPDLPGAAGYKSYGRGALLEEALKQFHDDGVGAEQSPTCAAFSLEWLLLGLGLAEATGEPFPDDVKRRLVRAGEHLRWITDDSGAQPRIGDDDEGRVIFSQTDLETRYVSSTLGCLSAALGRPQLAPPGFRPHLRNLALGWPTSAWPAPAGGAPEGVRGFQKGGYTVVRERSAGKSLMLVFDHGPPGGPSVAAHGHADALAIWLHVDGRPILIDAGAHLHHSDDPDRNRFRGTSVHNTLTLNGEDQSAPSGPFGGFRKAALCRLLTFVGLPLDWRVEAEHTGYKRRFGLVHRRRIEREADLSFSLRDRLGGSGSGDGVEAVLRYLVAPGLDVRLRLDGSARIRAAGRDILDLRLILDSEQRMELLAPAIGKTLVSQRLGDRTETTILTCAVPAAGLLRSSVVTRITVL